MATYAISVGVDPNKLRVIETTDSFGKFTTKEEAAHRLIAMVDERLDELRRSKAHARKILRASAC